MGNEEPSLREAVATLRANYQALDRRTTGLEAGQKDIQASLEVKHKENRLSIHDIRQELQNIIDLVHKIDLRLAKATGYAIGAGAVVATLTQLIEKYVHAAH